MIEHDFGPTMKTIVAKNKEQEQEEITAANLFTSITYISRYCHNLQSCNKCLIKKWCKEKRKKCPEEWTFTKNWRYGGVEVCQEIDTQVVDHNKKN